MFAVLLSSQLKAELSVNEERQKEKDPHTSTLLLKEMRQ